MFTGIIQAIGHLRKRDSHDGDQRMHFETGNLSLDGVAIGDSIAVNGVCLTAVRLSASGFVADVSRETVSLTTLGDLVSGAAVNLEGALRLGQALGGHLVSGHVDGVGQVLSRVPEGRSERVEVSLPPGLARYVAVKGSICLDGVSLTVNEARDNSFCVNVVPHTLQHTTAGNYQPGTRVNLEVDMIARYLERLLPTEPRNP